jgi:hydroxyacylglutathione hydrolase
VPLPRLAEWGKTRSRSVPILIHCASGYRSGIAVSLLRQMGFKDVRDVAGGIRRYVEHGFAVSRADEADGAADAHGAVDAVEARDAKP